MVERLVNWFITTLQGIPKELIILVISMVPVLELRGGLIAAALLRVPLWRALFICIVGNVIPIPFILLFITPIFNWLKRTKWLRGFVTSLEQRSLGKSEKIQKYQFWGLVLFVGIPLPGTGAWTGSLIAALLGIPLKKAFPAILLGVLLAAFIMCVVTYGIPSLFS